MYNRNHEHKVEEKPKTRQWRLEIVENVAFSTTDDLITIFK